MTTATLTLAPFPRELLTSWERFRRRWTTVVPLALVPLIPLVFALPFLVELAQLRAAGATGIPSPISATLGIIALVALYLASIPTRAGIFHVYTQEEHVRPRAALRAGLRRFWPFFLTELALVLFLGLALLPPAALSVWYTNVGRATVGTLSTRTLTDVTVALLTLLVSLPVIFLATVFAFAPLDAATNASGGALTALRRSWALVRRPGALWPVFWRLSLWIALFVVICNAVEPLPFAGWLVPFFMTLIGAAFLVTLYTELKNFRVEAPS